MRKGDKERLLYLEKRIPRLRTEFSAAQAELERLVETYGLGSSEAAEASALCGSVTLWLSDAEEELDLLQFRR